MVSQQRFGLGLCYVLQNDLSYDEVYEPCRGESINKEHEDYGLCQAGTSGAFLDDGTMMMGAPGSVIWRGSLFVTATGGSYLDRDKNIYKSGSLDNATAMSYGYLGE